jgi:hypothetical protein
MSPLPTPHSRQPWRQRLAPLGRTVFATGKCPYFTAVVVVVHRIRSQAVRVAVAAIKGLAVAVALAA